MNTLLKDGSQAITFRTLPAMAGVYWVHRGWVLFKSKPWTIFSAVLLTMLIDLLCSQLSVLGTVFSALLTPAINLGLMGIIAVRLVPVKQTMLQQLLVVFNKPIVLKRMLRLGFVYTVAIGVMIGLAQVLAGEEFFKMQIELAKGAVKLNDPMAQAVMGEGFSKILPMLAVVIAAFWFTSQLVGWHGQSIPKALFFNAMAFWRNKWAFIVYALAWALIAIAASLISVVFLEIDQSFLIILTALYNGMMSWFVCSMYASYESTIELIEVK